MNREQWKSKYRQWRVQDRVWRELQKSKLYKIGDPVPAFVTWDYYMYSPTRLFGDTLKLWNYTIFTELRRNTHSLRMRHLHQCVRLPA